VAFGRDLIIRAPQALLGEVVAGGAPQVALVFTRASLLVLVNKAVPIWPGGPRAAWLAIASARCLGTSLVVNSQGRC